MNETENIVISYAAFGHIIDLLQAVESCQITEEQITRCDELRDSIIAALPTDILGMSASFAAIESLKAVNVCDICGQTEEGSDD